MTQLPCLAEEWAQRPPAAQEFVLSVLVRVQVVGLQLAAHPLTSTLLGPPPA